jgi:hypothetical protein
MPNLTWRGKTAIMLILLVRGSARRRWKVCVCDLKEGPGREQACS